MIYSSFSPPDFHLSLSKFCRNFLQHRRVWIKFEHRRDFWTQNWWRRPNSLHDACQVGGRADAAVGQSEVRPVGDHLHSIARLGFPLGSQRYLVQLGPTDGKCLRKADRKFRERWRETGETRRTFWPMWNGTTVSSSACRIRRGLLSVCKLQKRQHMSLMIRAKKTNNPKCFQSGFVSRKTYFLSLENEMLILSRMFQSKLSKPGRNMYSWTYGKKRRKRKFNTVNN